jgi:hypothetical protein
LCANDFSDLNLTDAISVNRDYQVTEAGLENWQHYYIEDKLVGYDNLGECQEQMTMVVEYQKLSGTWVELWNYRESSSDPEYNREHESIYVEVLDTYKKLWLRLNQTEFERNIQLEFETQEDFHAVPMRFAYKTVAGDLISDLKGEFTITVYGQEKEDPNEAHPCADVTITKSSQSGNQPLSFAAEWNEEWDQMVDVYAQGALTVKKSGVDANVECPTYYKMFVYDEVTDKFSKWTGEQDKAFRDIAGHELNSGFWIDEWGSFSGHIARKDYKSLQARFTDDNGDQAVKIQIKAFVIGSTANGPDATGANVPTCEFALEVIPEDTVAACENNNVFPSDTVVDGSLREIVDYEIAQYGQAKIDYPIKAL